METLATSIVGRPRRLVSRLALPRPRKVVVAVMQTRPNRGDGRWPLHTLEFSQHSLDYFFLLFLSCGLVADTPSFLFPSLLYCPTIWPPTMRLLAVFGAILSIAPCVFSSPYRDDLTDYNININQDATDPTQYQSTRPNTTYTPSPTNWRALPVYTILLDKFADGDPTNNDFFQSVYEYDIRETQLRYGGDLKVLVSKLDYLHGMGIRVIFMSGTPFLNMIWQADSALSLLFIGLLSVLNCHPRLFSPRFQCIGPSLGHHC